MDKGSGVLPHCWPFGHKKPHHQIEITSRTGLLFTNERSGVTYYVTEVGRLTPHHQIEITSRTGLLFTNERSGVTYDVTEVGRLACLQLVGRYVACFA